MMISKLYNYYSMVKACISLPYQQVKLITSNIIFMIMFQWCKKHAGDYNYRSEEQFITLDVINTMHAQW